MGAIWLLPTAALGVLAVVSTLMTRRLATELRATAEALASIAEATASVRDDVVRARRAIDSLDLPSVREATAERTLAMVVRWAARRVLPF